MRFGTIAGFSIRFHASTMLSSLTVAKQYLLGMDRKTVNYFFYSLSLFLGSLAIIEWQRI